MPTIGFVNDKAGKPVGIYRAHRSPPDPGNSDSDMQMIQYTMAGEGRRLGLFVHHTDADREYAYDRKATSAHWTRHSIRRMPMAGSLWI